MNPAQALQARAEVLKLAQILGREPATVAYLQEVPVDDLRALRDQVTEVLWSAHSGALGRLATASRLLPDGVSANISQRAFGPMLTARMAALLEPARAVEVATRLPTPFLADVAIELDPRRASEVVTRLAAAQIAEVTGELVRREEYVTMGRFVGHLSDEALIAALLVMDDRSLLRVTFVLEDKGAIERIVELLAAQRFGGLVRAAAEGGLWLEMLDLMAHLSELQLDEIVTATLEVLSKDQRREVAQRARDTGVIGRLGALGHALAEK